MTNKIAIEINVPIFSDGTSTNLTIDLQKDPYWIRPGGGADVLTNWFAQDKGALAPSDVTAYPGDLTYTSVALSGTKLDVVLANAFPPGLGNSIRLVLLF